MKKALIIIEVPVLEGHEENVMNYTELSPIGPYNQRLLLHTVDEDGNRTVATKEAVIKEIKIEE